MNKKFGRPAPGARMMVAEFLMLLPSTDASGALGLPNPPGSGSCC
jgi:hypothetical protein